VRSAPLWQQKRGSRNEVLFEAVDKLMAAVLAVMVLFAVVDMAIFLGLGRD
jgi:hypothetical protein